KLLHFIVPYTKHFNLSLCVTYSIIYPAKFDVYYNYYRGGPVCPSYHKIITFWFFTMTIATTIIRVLPLGFFALTSITRSSSSCYAWLVPPSYPCQNPGRTRRHSRSLHSKFPNGQREVAFPNWDRGSLLRKKKKILVLGGTGFVGSRVCEVLRQKKIPFVAASMQGTDGSIRLDLTEETAARQLAEVCETENIYAIVSAVGSIFSNRDYEINSASGRVARTAFGSGDGSKNYAIPKFIFIGNSERVRNLCQAIPQLREYARGKEESERLIRETFGTTTSRDGEYCIIKPTFIYGGGNFSVNPPRLPRGSGEIVEALLGLYPIQALSEALPGVLGVAFEAPVNVDAVARAIVNVATGLCERTNNALESREDIIMAASKREGSMLKGPIPNGMNARREQLKRMLSQRAMEFTPEQNFAMLEELERLKPIDTRPTDDVSLNGRWDFCFDVEPDVGTGFIKELFEGNGPQWIKKILDFQGVHMEIGNQQSTIQLVLSIAFFGKQTDLILHTSLSPAPINPDGTMFLEKFEGIEFAGIGLPYPDAWKRSRYLEFSYLDDEFAVARGAGGEPHFLLRGK
ncbi:hypothetical protein ACHAXS_003190, partial [Conticribra weissflogii]